MSSTDSKLKPGRQLRLQEGGLLIVIFILGAVLTIFGGRVSMPELRKNADGEMERVMVEKNKFLNSRTLVLLAKDTSFIAIMAVGMTFVIVSGGIDLSVGAIYAIASVIGATVFSRFGLDGSGNPSAVLPGILACIGAGMACGLCNGAMIVALKVHPFIITLGTMAVFRGIAFVVTNGQSIGGLPSSFRDFVKCETESQLSVVPLGVTLVMMIAGIVYLSRLAAGRKIYAVGGNELASRFSGIHVSRTKLSVYVISGFTAGVSALLALGYYGSASSSDGQTYELNVIAAAVVGGASLSGGKGSALGAILGALILQMISTGIVILGINQNYSQIITGAVVIIAVVLDQFNNWLTKRRLTRTT